MGWSLPRQTLGLFQTMSSPSMGHAYISGSCRSLWVVAEARVWCCWFGVTPFLLVGRLLKENLLLELGICVISERPLQSHLHQQTTPVDNTVYTSRRAPPAAKTHSPTQHGVPRKITFSHLLFSFFSFFFWPVHLSVPRTSGG